MPYGIRKQGNQYCVYNTETSKTVPGGCHPDQEEASDHMKALYANVDDAGEKKTEGKKVTKSVKSYGRGDEQNTSPQRTDYRWKGR